MEAIPFWVGPFEPMSAEAIALMCDADRRSVEFDSMIVRVKSFS